MKRPTVAIVGVGLMGGSLGLALRRARRVRVLGIGRRTSTLRQARRAGAVDEYTTDVSRAAEADWVILCSPVDTLIPFLQKLKPHLRPGTWVTDVCSVKGPVVKGLQTVLRGSPVRFAGSHPLCGSHRTGVAAARADLYEGATCVIVPADGKTVAPLLGFWKSVGAKPVIMNARAHDDALALTSHLPHLIAHALVGCVVRRRDRQALTRLMAGSFRDTTRVASSDSAQWAQILGGNRSAVRVHAKRFIAELQRLSRLIGSPRLERHLMRSQAFRAPLFEGQFLR